MRLWKKKLPSREDKPYKQANKITDKALDDHSIKVLIGLLNGKVIKSMDYPIARGKEAVVYRATTPENVFLAVKIYKYETSGLRHMEEYITGDPRFRKASKNRRELVQVWAGKEFANLRKAFEAGVSCPKPLKLRENIVLMSFEGEEGVPYAQLSDVVVEYPEALFAELMVILRKLYSVKLVHADLSPYNILIKPVEKAGKIIQKPIVIDWGQAVLIEHPKSAEFLERDVRNLCVHFTKLGVECDEEKELKIILASLKPRA